MITLKEKITKDTIEYAKQSAKAMMRFRTTAEGKAKENKYAATIANNMLKNMQCKDIDALYN